MNLCVENSVCEQERRRWAMMSVIIQSRRVFGIIIIGIFH